MPETVPLESVSRWLGLSPWVALLPWRMAGRHPELKPGRPLCKAVCGASPRNQVRGRLRRASGTGPTPNRSRGEDLCDACGVGGRGMEARRGAGGGGNAPRAGRCLVERSARASSRKKATTRGPGRALKRPVCLTGRQPLLGLRQRRATLRSGPRASPRQGPEPPEAAPRDDLAGPPAHPQDRRDLKRAVVSGGRQGGGLSLGRDSAADGRIAPAGLRHPSHRTGRATFMASGSPLDGL